MSSNARVLGPVSVASAGANAKKRVLTDSEDTEDRELKRVRHEDVAGERGKQKELKDKKKRRKRRRKVSVVQALDSSDAEGPLAPPEPSLSCVPSQSPSSIGPDVCVADTIVQPDPRQQSAGPSSMPVVRISSAPNTCDDAALKCENSPLVDKGKERAPPEGGGTQSGTELEMNDLKEQVSAKAKLVLQHENLVSALQQSLSCQICLDLMHRPFVISPCGHSACYQCLVNWFKAPPADVPVNEVPPPWLRRKTCPHCRAIVKERPSEIWTIKEMVATLVKSGLAPAFYNPPVEPEEGAANIDPWAGIFRPVRRDRNVLLDEPWPAPLHHLGLRDDEDGGIYRCIECHHEIWDGSCSGCGRDYPGLDPAEDVLDEFDEDDDDIPWEDDVDAGAWPDRLAFLQHLRDALVPPNPNPMLDDLRDDDSLDYDWDEGGDTEIESDNDTRGRDGAMPRGRVRAHVRDEDLDGADEEDGYESSFIDDDDGANASGGSPVGRRPSSIHRGSDVIELSDNEDDDDRSVRFVSSGGGRAPIPARRRGPIVITSDVYHDHEYDGSDHSVDDYGDEHLANEVAAREIELYGDDGSVPRGGRRYTSYESEDDLY